MLMFINNKNIANHTSQVTLARRICSTCSLEVGEGSLPSVWEEAVEIPLLVSTIGEMCARGHI